MNTMNLKKFLSGFFNIDTIQSDEIPKVMTDVLLRMGLKMDLCRRQCYNWAANMACSKKGVAT